MHSSLHTFAHRAPSGARAKVRWQPYASLQSSVSTTTASSSIPSRSTPTNYLNTPASTVSPSPYSTPATSCSDRLAKLPPPPPTTSLPSKDPQSKKFAHGLVDQAVKMICDTWRNEDIPSVFLTADRATLAQLPIKVSPVTSTTEILSKSRRNTQLPSPISPTTQPSPSAAESYSATVVEIEPTCMFGSKTNLIPIKGFVHEVLRRSRTSGCVLQTALCYLEAIKPRLPNLIKQEQAGLGTHFEPEVESRISMATPAEIESDNDINTSSDDGLDTVRICDTSSATVCLDAADSAPDGDTLKKPKAPSAPLAPLPPLPSPLLCPRRAFLAALILASKFTQDKCYSNRAWAKLSGLPAREISRCERTLGDALEWRLWVGKRPAVVSATPPSPPLVSRPVSRCRSESDLRRQRHASFLVAPEQILASANVPPTPSEVLVDRPNLSGLRRSSTLPADAFSVQRPPKVEAVDQYMASPEADYISSLPNVDVQRLNEPSSIEYPPTEVIPTNDNFGSPCPPTPNLTYSPTLTDSSSSSGDRTIQMTSLDEPFPPYTASIDGWLWAEPTSTTSPPNFQALGAVYDANQLASAFAQQFPIPVQIPPFLVDQGAKNHTLLSNEVFSMRMDPNILGAGYPQMHLEISA